MHTGTDMLIPSTLSSVLLPSTTNTSESLLQLHTGRSKVVVPSYYKPSSYFYFHFHASLGALSPPKKQALKKACINSAVSGAVLMILLISVLSSPEHPSREGSSSTGKKAGEKRKKKENKACFSMDLVKGTTPAAKAGLSSWEHAWCTSASEPQHLDSCRTPVLPPNGWNTPAVAPLL